MAVKITDDIGLTNAMIENYKHCPHEYTKGYCEETGILVLVHLNMKTACIYVAWAEPELR